MHVQAQAIEQHFFEALELGLVERADLLARLGRDEPVLARRVQSLLAAHERAEGYLARPPAAVDGRALLASAEALAEETRQLQKDRTARRLPLAAEGILAPPRREGDIGSLGRYDVVRWLGMGGMGIVFLAHDSRLDRPVAIKALKPHRADDPTSRRRFLREARAIAALKHDHIVAIHEVQEDAAVPYLVMEYVPGGTLLERLNSEGPLPATEIARIGSEVAQALAAAHGLGLVHRDVKPGNILLERPRGRTKLSDFGLVRAPDVDPLTEDDIFELTPQYASPEQINNRPLDGRSDLFSLGSVLYTLAVGQPPFVGENTIAIIRSVVEAPPPELARFRPDLPRALCKVIEALLQKDPARRPASAADVAEALGRLARDPNAAIGSWNRRRISAAAVAVLAAAIGLPLAIGVGWRAWLGSGPAPLDAVNQTKSATADTAPAPVETPQVAPPDAPPEPVEAAAPRSVAELFGELGVLRKQGQLMSLLVSRDGTAMYVSGDFNAIVAWSTRSDPPARQFAALGDRVGEMALSPDGTRLAAVARGRMLCIYDTADGTILTKLPSMVPLRQLAFSHDGSLLLAAPWLTPAAERMLPTTVGVHVDPRAIGVYDAKTLQHVKYLRPKREQAFFTIDCDPSGKYVAAGTQGGTVLLFDLQSGEQVGEFDGQVGPNFNVRFSAGGEHLWSTGNENTLVCRKVPSGEQVYRRLIARPITRIAVSSDESWVAMGGGVLDVRVIDLTGQVGQDGIVTFSGHTSSIFGVAFLPGDRELVSCAHDSTVRLWRLPRRPRAASPP